MNIEQTLASLDDKVQNLVNKTNEETENANKIGRMNSEEIKTLSGEIESINAALQEMAQNGLNVDGQNEPQQTAGEQFVNSQEFSNFKNGMSQRARVDLDVKNNTVIGSDATVAPDRQSGVVGGAFRRFMIRDLMPSYNTSSNAIEYTRENVFTNQAAEQATEGAQKAESSITFELKSMPIATVAHFIKISKQLMDDAPAITAYIDQRMRYGVELREENQLLAGDGLTGNINGLLNSGNYTVFTPGVGVKAMDNIRKAITIAEQADYVPNAVIMNPADVEALDLEKASDGHFVNNGTSSPRIAMPTMAWGLPVVKSNAITAGQFLVGAFDMAAASWQRQGITVDLFEQDGDNVQKNLLTLRAEKRCALTVFRPASLVGGTLTA